MPPREERPSVIRIVEGLSGTIDMRLDLVVRFDYGKTIPWAEKTEQGLRMLAGPNGLMFQATVPTEGKDLAHVANFAISEGAREEFAITWFPSNEDSPELRRRRGKLQTHQGLLG